MYSIKLSAKMRKIMTYILHPLSGDSLKWKMKQLEIKVTPRKRGRGVASETTDPISQVKMWPECLWQEVAARCFVFPSVLHNLH